MFNLIVAYVLVARVGRFDLRQAKHAVVLGRGPDWDCSSRHWRDRPQPRRVPGLGTSLFYILLDVVVTSTTFTELFIGQSGQSMNLPWQQIIP